MKFSRKRTRDEAADTVIGFILIMLIAIAAITLVLINGEPALERVQAQQESDSMLRYYADLETEVSGIITGSPAGVTPVWRVAMPRGDLNVENTHIWAYAVDRQVGGNTYRIDYDAFGDGDDTITVRNAPSGSTALPAGARIDFLRHQGAVETAAGTTTLAGGLATGATLDITLPVALTDNVVELRFYLDGTSTTPVARAWFIDGGAVVWHMPAGGATQRVAFENTGVVAEQGGASFISNEPKVRQPKARTSTIDDVFLRVVRIDGAVSVAGRTTAEILVASGGTYSRYASASEDRVQIYPPLRWQEAWATLLDDDTLGYTFTVDTHSFGTGSTGQRVATYEAGAKTLATGFVETDITMEVITRS